MTYTKEDIIKDLSALGIGPGDTILMHSSYKALGTIQGGAETFFKAFAEVLGHRGTLVLPSLSFESVTPRNPHFDLHSTPGCVGYLAEYFRTQVPGVKRSLHPTHSCCALGKNGEEIISGHERDKTPVGKNSPFYKIRKYKGKVLMLGCGTRCNTSMHGVEEMKNLPYCVDYQNPVKYIITNGEQRFERALYPHDFSNSSGGHLVQRYDRLVPLLSEEELTKGRILEAEAYLMDSNAIWEKGAMAIDRDPMYFVDE